MPKYATPQPRIHLKKRKGENKGYLVISLRFKKKQLTYSLTNYLTNSRAPSIIAERYWDSKAGQTIYSKKHGQDYINVNEQLKSIKKFIIDLFQENPTITHQDLKLELDYFTGEKKRPNNNGIPDFIPFVERLLEERMSKVNSKRGTWKILKTVFNHLKQHGKENGKELNYEDFTFEFKHSFENWLYLPPRKHSTNYASKVFSVIRQFLHEATRRGYNTNFSFKQRGWSIPKEKVQKTILTFPELETLYNLDLSNNLKLDRVRDLFLIGAYSGLRFSDFTRIKPEHIIIDEGIEMIKIWTKKTDTQVFIPLVPELKILLEKYNYHSPKAISNQKMNDYLKELCKLAEIKEEIISKKSVAGKTIEQKKEKWQLITTHTARRSFATNFYEMGIPAIQLMQVTGHTTEKQFMGYINIDKKQNAKNIAKTVAMILKQSKLKVVS